MMLSRHSWPVGAVCAAAFVLAAPALAEVEARLLSTWRATVSNASGTWILDFRPEFDGRYRTRITGPAPLPDDTGTIEAADGRWSVVKDDGSTDAGTYVFATDDVVAFTGAGGTVVWQRQSSLPALATAPPPAPGFGSSSPTPLPGPPTAPVPTPACDWPPAGLPSQAAGLLERARQWQADAVLEAIETDRLSGGSAVVANLQTPPGNATLKFIYCSPATRRRLVISPGKAFGETWEGESPRCDAARTPPPDFLDLPDAVARARARGLAAGDPQSASLGYVTGVEGEEPSGWMWRIHPPRNSNDQVYEIPAAATVAGTVRRIDACALLTAADAGALIGAAESAEGGYLVANTWGCAWQAPGDPGRRVALVIDENPHRDAAVFIDNQLRNGRTAVNDIGDRAVLFDSPAGAASLDILVGDTLLQLVLARPEDGRDPAIRELGRTVTARFAEGQGVAVTSGPLERLRGQWRAAAGGNSLVLDVDAHDAFTVSTRDPATGAANPLGSGSVRWQSGRSRVIFDPSPSLVSAAQKRRLRGFYGSMVLEERQLSGERMGMQGHDLVTIDWSREGATPAAGPGSTVGPLPLAPPPVGNAPAANPPAAGGTDSGMDRKIEKAGTTIQGWADKAGRKIGGFLDRLGGSSDGD